MNKSGKKIGKSPDVARWFTSRVKFSLCFLVAAILSSDKVTLHSREAPYLSYTNQTIVMDYFFPCTSLPITEFLTRITPVIRTF